GALGGGWIAAQERQLAGVERVPGVFRMLLAVFRQQRVELVCVFVEYKLTGKRLECHASVRRVAIRLQAAARLVRVAHEFADVSGTLERVLLKLACRCQRRLGGLRL